MLSKGLLHKPVLSMAKARQQYHSILLINRLLCSKVDPQKPVLILMPVDSQGHSVDMPVFKSSLGEEVPDLRVPGAEGR